MAKILLADDEKDIVEFFGRILQKEGFDVFTATNGEDCLNLAKKTRPDLLLLDINMPGMDGGTVAGRLLEYEETKNIPVIFVSGMIRKEEEANIKGRLFISKGNTKEEIIKKIRGVLAGKA